MSLLERFKDATIGFSGYPRLARTKDGGFGYMAVLLLVVLGIAAAIAAVNTKRELAGLQQKLAAAPEFRLQDGRFVFEGPMPFEIRHGGLQVIMDTTGKTTKADLEGKQPGTILLTAEGFHQVPAPGRVQSFDFATTGLTITKAAFLDLIGGLHRVVPFSYLLVYLFQLGAKALDAIILAVIALLFGRAAKRPVSFDLAWKLGLYAMTMSILIQWIWPYFTVLSPVGFTIWWGLSVFYLMMGLRAYWESEPGAA